MYHLLHRKIKRYNLVADKKLHATVIIKEGHQLTVLTDLVLYIPHEGPQARVHAAIGIAHHAALEITSTYTTIWQNL